MAREKGKSNSGKIARMLNAKQRYDLTVWYQSQIGDGQAIHADDDSAITASSVLGFAVSPCSITTLRNAIGIKAASRSSRRAHPRLVRRQRERKISALHKRIQTVEEYLSEAFEFTPYMEQT